MKRPQLLALFALFAFSACGGPGPGPAVTDFGPYEIQPVGPDAPTVILISIDTLRADRLGCYGSEQPTSPMLDIFREQAVLFECAIAQAPSTLPSHASIFTSMIPEHHGAFFSRRLPVSPSVPMLTTILADAGYRTAAFTGGGQIAPEFGLDRDFSVYGVNQGGPKFSSAVASGLEWLGEVRGQTGLFVPPHLRGSPSLHAADPISWIFSTMDMMEISRIIFRKSSSKRSTSARSRSMIVISSMSSRPMMPRSGRSMRHSETFSRGSEELGLAENSLIIFTSDHGEEFGEHGVVGWHSHTLYDELLRVPLLIRFPGELHGGLSIP